jgi:hypothetical protein
MKKLGKDKTGGSGLDLKRLEDGDMRVLGELIARTFAAMKKKYGG